MRRGATRSLGLDVGDRHIGIALSDTIGILATPLTILERRDESKDIEAIVDIISQRQVKKIVIGLPYTMNGSIGQQAEKVLAFVEKLNIKTKVPVILRDERLTTVSARRLMQATITKKNRRKTRDDAIAAAIILQGYLDEAY
ncbi:MAG: Holliday junction resolvase RuvX [Dehalococcoidales bacterium]|nr:Holliday junction resolvase RuvX [Dehalococcoidales bacterium]MDP7109931.1 Holliday junction resolvase RuvX [Dehalococcoidales bacterium]MDP7309723.1 Holliday junction resolvase RuvX [Dehalococcoidales bacterium]MDP7409344.1 Holliday junction resolvase RuvX [Dehalococcoidales bacterium]MDP7675679.1 Holliday junction resolvase RuvX [Dehalococcoidales bacterium]